MIAVDYEHRQGDVQVFVLIIDWSSGEGNNEQKQNDKRRFFCRMVSKVDISRAQTIFAEKRCCFV